jgi:hypothetical protein
LVLGRFAGFLEQVAQVEPACEHRKPAVGGVRPNFARPVSVKFDAVFIGIAQIERFADAMIGSAVERNVGRDQPPQYIGKPRARRIENGEMIEAGTPERWRLAAAAFPGVEAI